MADPIRQLLSQSSWIADGAQTVWNFSFQGGYLDKSHVKASRLTPTGTRTEIEVTLGMFVGPYQLNITPAVPAGHELTIYRNSLNGGLPLVAFIDRANLTEAGLDLQAKQAVFVAAEASDNLTGAVDSVSQIVQFTEAAASAAAESASYRDQALVHVGTAAGHAATALTHSNTAAGHAATSLTHANTSAGYRDQALGYRDQAATFATNSYNSSVSAAASAASIAGGPVTSVAGLTGVVGTAPLKTALALNNVENVKAVRAGGGLGQHLGHDMYVGWDGATRVKMTVNATDWGNVVFDSNLNAAVAGRLAIAGGTLQGNLTIAHTGQGYIGIRRPNSGSQASLAFEDAGAIPRYVQALTGDDIAMYMVNSAGTYLGDIYRASQATKSITWGVRNVVKTAAPFVDGSGNAVFIAAEGDVGSMTMSTSGTRVAYLAGGVTGQRITWVIQNNAAGNVMVLASDQPMVKTGEFNNAGNALNIIEAVYINGSWFATVAAYG